MGSGNNHHSVPNFPDTGSLFLRPESTITGQSQAVNVSDSFSHLQKQKVVAAFRIRSVVFSGRQFAYIFISVDQVDL